MSFLRRAGAEIARIIGRLADPAAEVGRLLLYAKDVAGITQLFARASDGTISQLTPVVGTENLVFKPGSGLTGPVVFDTWAALYAQLTLLRSASNGGGIYVIQFDGSAGVDIFSLTIPAGAHDMTGVTWEGTPAGNPISGTTPTFVSIAEGATFTGGPYKIQDLAIFSRATTTPPWTFTSAWGEEIDLSNVIVTAETLPISVFRASGGGLVTFVMTGSTFGDGTNVVLEADAGSGAGLRLRTSSLVLPNAFITIDDGSIGATIEASSARITDSQPLAPGYSGATQTTLVRHETNDIETADAAAYPGQLNRFDASGDPPASAQLPAASLNDNRFQWALVKETSGAPSASGDGFMGLTIAPDGLDTIDGNSGPYLLLPGAQVALVSDGVGGWNSAWKTAGVPEKVFASVVIAPSGGLEKRIAFFNVGNTTPGSGVVKNGTGDWTITFNNPFPVGYFPVATFGLRGPGVTAICSYETIDNSNIQIFTNDPTGTPVDPNYVNVVVHLIPEITTG